MARQQPESDRETESGSLERSTPQPSFTGMLHVLVLWQNITQSVV